MSRLSIYIYAPQPRVSGQRTIALFRTKYYSTWPLGVLCPSQVYGIPHKYVTN